MNPPKEHTPAKAMELSRELVPKVMRKFVRGISDIQGHSRKEIQARFQVIIIDILKSINLEPWIKLRKEGSKAIVYFE